MSVLRNVVLIKLLYDNVGCRCNQQCIELLVEKCLRSAGETGLNPGDALLRVFEAVSSGILLPGLYHRRLSLFLYVIISRCLASFIQEILRGREDDKVSRMMCPDSRGTSFTSLFSKKICWHPALINSPMLSTFLLSSS